MEPNKLYIRTQKAIAGIELDAVISESHTNTVKLTTNPVEVGSDVTDNAVVEAKVINIIADVTDTPLSPASQGLLIDPVTDRFGTSTALNLTRSAVAYNAMVDLMNARNPIDVQTKLKLYNNMVITALAVTQDKDTSRMVAMDITMTELLLTTSRTVPTKLQASQVRGATKQQAQTGEEKGNVDVEKVPDNTSQSYLVHIRNLFQ